jgi:hypothetical protein
MTIHSRAPHTDRINRAGFSHSRPFFIAILLVTTLVGASCGNQNSEPVSNSPAQSNPLEAKGQPAPDHTGSQVFGAFQVTIPSGWNSQPPSSSLRKAQFTLPGPAGNAEIAVFNFPGQGGSVDANIERWIGQFSQPDGSSSKSKAKIREKQVSGFKITVLDVSGIYQGGMMPGMGESRPQPNTRMLAAVVETPDGPWFFKLTGPSRTVAQWQNSLEQMLDSIQSR